MSEMMVQLWNQAAEAFDQRYQQIGEQWETATPCDEFNVRQLCEHAAGAQVGLMAELVGADVAEGAEWPAVYQAVTSAMSAESVSGMTTHPMMGEVPKARLVGIAVSDLTVHTWDLARGLGTDDTLPEACVTAVHEGLQQFPAEMMRAPGMFNDIVEVANDASAQDKMIAFTGRQP